MDEAIGLKFKQHPELKDELLATGNKLLVEVSGRDFLYRLGSPYAQSNTDTTGHRTPVQQMRSGVTVLMGKGATSWARRSCVCAVGFVTRRRVEAMDPLQTSRTVRHHHRNLDTASMVLRFSI